MLSALLFLAMPVGPPVPVGPQPTVDYDPAGVQYTPHAEPVSYAPVFNLNRPEWEPRQIAPVAPGSTPVKTAPKSPNAAPCPCGANCGCSLLPPGSPGHCGGVSCPAFRSTPVIAVPAYAPPVVVRPVTSAECVGGS